MSTYPTAPTTEILFFDGFDDIDAIAPFEILTAAGFPVRAVGVPADDRTVRLSGTDRTAELHDPPAYVTSAHGLRLALRDELGEPALVVIPGGGWYDPPRGVRALAAGSLPAQLARRHEQGTVLASVCTGAMVLAAAGLLTGRPAVTHRSALRDLAQAGADVRDQARVVDDGSVVTCGGPAAGIDLALHLVERFLGPDAAAQATERIEHRRVGPEVITNRLAA